MEIIRDCIVIEIKNFKILEVLLKTYFNYLQYFSINHIIHFVIEESLQLIMLMWQCFKIYPCALLIVKLYNNLIGNCSLFN